MSKHVYISDLDPDEYEQALMSVIVEHREKVRKKAFSEVLEKVEQFRLMHHAFCNDSSQSDTMRRYHGTKENAFLELKDWLTGQLDNAT